MLQWGHNFFVMEMHQQSNYFQQTDYSFNGAITFSLWKLNEKPKEEEEEERLQWGHNFFVMEIYQ